MPLMLAMLLISAQPAAAAPPAEAPAAAFATVTFKQDETFARFRRLGGPGPYFPEKADRMHRGGEAVLDCLPGQDGALDDCRLVSETPEGFGFGGAAMVMAKRRWMTLAAPADAQPHTADGRVRVRVSYKTP